MTKAHNTTIPEVANPTNSPNYPPNYLKESLKELISSKDSIERMAEYTLQSSMIESFFKHMQWANTSTEIIIEETKIP
jgi:hypothetical protein